MENAFLQDQDNNRRQEIKKDFSGRQIGEIILLIISVIVFISLLTTRVIFFPGDFTPVILTDKEQEDLDNKLEIFARIGNLGICRLPVSSETDETETVQEEEPGNDMQPLEEPYIEKGVAREITFSEREVNALLTRNTSLAKKLSIDLADDFISAKLLLPVNPDIPVLGGKTLSLRAGIELEYSSNKPIIKFKGITLLGIPIPDDWLVGPKDINLVEKFGGSPGYWKTFSNNVTCLKVKEGQIIVSLKQQS